MGGNWAFGGHSQSVPSLGCPPLGPKEGSIFRKWVGGAKGSAGEAGKAWDRQWGHRGVPGAEAWLGLPRWPLTVPATPHHSTSAAVYTVGRPPT